MSKSKLWLGVVLVAAVAWYLHSRGGDRAPRPADGVLVGNGPLRADTGMGSHADYSTAFTRSESVPTSTIDITGRVLARRVYRPTPLEDPIALDLVLGWGPMSDNRVLDHLAVKQDARRFGLVPDSRLPLPLQQAYDSAMNLSVYTDDFPRMHRLEAIRVGDVVRIVGWTLIVRDQRGATWGGRRSSTERPGSSDVVLVQMLQVNDQKQFGDWETLGTRQFLPW